MSAELSWAEWTTSNLTSGCSKDEIRSILLENGFSDTETQALMLGADSNPDRASGNDHSRSPINNVITDSPSQIHLQNAIAIENEKIELYAVENFLNENECAQIVSLIREHNRPSTTTEEGVSEFRTSFTCDLAKLNHPLIEEIDRRMCAYMGLRPEESEQIQGQLYEVGQQFKAHTDYFHQSSDTYSEHINQLGQRSWTFMVYLNNTRDGGATEFPNLDLSIQPTAGTALIWNNRSADGSCNADTLHCGSAVKSGYKAILTKWFRTPNMHHSFNKEDNELLPALTRSGYLVTNAPEEIHSDILQFYKAHKTQPVREEIPEFIQGESSSSPSQLVELPDSMRARIHSELKPGIENWIGDYVDPTYVYGIREYGNSAMLKMHRDRLQTHIASAIINIDQTTDRDWPLVIEDHYYRKHQVFLRPGQMLLYEGAKLRHGRPEPFQGRTYANVFVHYQLRTS